MKGVVERRESRGFTLIEVTITLGIIAVLSAVVLLLFHPLQRFSEARDVQRVKSIEELAEIISQCVFQREGSVPEVLSQLNFQEAYIIGSAPTGCSGLCNTHDTQKACLDISKMVCDDGKLLVPDYIASIPIDPDQKKWSREKTGFYIKKISSRQITLGACDPENRPISITREF